MIAQRPRALGRTLKENMENTFEKAAPAPAPAPTGPRVTAENIEQAIDGEYYIRPADAFSGVKHETMTVITICILILTNGTAVIGKSIPVSVVNFNEETGRKLAREDAVRGIWPLLGFLLKERIAQETAVAQLEQGL